jgi:tetratricopeptide (TPR) repeat protein
MKLILLLSLLLMLSPVFPAHAVNIHYGAAAPQFDLQSTGGENVSLSDYKEKIVVLLYWKSAQKYSIDALEDCRVFFNTYKTRGVQFIGLIADTEDVQKVRKIMKDGGIDFPVLIDTGRQVYGTYGVRVYPTTIIIDRKGKYFRSIPGHAVTYNTKLEAYLRNMLGEIQEMELAEIVSLQRKGKEKSKLERKAVRKYNLALKFAGSGMIDQAITSAKNSIEIKPDMPRTHVLLGSLYLEIEDVEKSLEEFQRALELDPESYEAKTGQGRAYILQGELDRAVKILTEAAALNPHPETVYYQLGRAYELKGEERKAMEMYKKAADKVTKNNYFNQE